MIVFLDRQHAGKIHRLADRGAFGDLDGDGTADGDGAREIEAMLTPVYMLHAEKRLIELGHSVVWLCDGTYKARAKRAQSYTPRGDLAAYIACHINCLGAEGGAVTANSGRYGAAFYDSRSKAGHGDRLAQAIKFELEMSCPELSEVKALPCSRSKWARAFTTIRHVGRPVATCFEPGFLDQDAHRDLWLPSGLQRIGEALAEAIDNWAHNMEGSK